MTAQATEIAACEADVRAFPDKVATLPPRPDTTLRRLWLAAADAHDAVHAHLRATVGERGEDLELERRQDAAYETEHALRDHLLTEHGLTTADLARSVL